jgi:hypothetical protein
MCEEFTQEDIAMSHARTDLYDIFFYYRTGDSAGERVVAHITKLEILAGIKGAWGSKGLPVTENYDDKNITTREEELPFFREYSAEHPDYEFLLVDKETGQKTLMREGDQIDM